MANAQKKITWCGRSITKEKSPFAILFRNDESGVDEMKNAYCADCCRLNALNRNTMNNIHLNSYQLNASKYFECDKKWDIVCLFWMAAIQMRDHKFGPKWTHHSCICNRSVKSRCQHQTAVSRPIYVGLHLRKRWMNRLPQNRGCVLCVAYARCTHRISYVQNGHCVRHCCVNTLNRNTIQHTQGAFGRTRKKESFCRHHVPSERQKKVVGKKCNMMINEEKNKKKQESNMYEMATGSIGKCVCAHRSTGVCCVCIMHWCIGSASKMHQASHHQ